MITWTEMLVIGGIIGAAAGKKDLPNAAYWVGTQFGRLVGFIQGARARADQYSQNSELRSLQNELRAGLRELDAVRAEMTTTLAQPLMGRQQLRPGVNRMASGAAGTAAMVGQQPHMAAATMSKTSPLSSNNSNNKNPHPLGPTLKSGGGGINMNPILSSPSSAFPAPTHPMATDSTATSSTSGSGSELWAPTSHAIGAIAEEEWVRQGIEFKSRAELGEGMTFKQQQQPQQQSQQQQQQQSSMSSSSYDHSTAGSVVLSNLLQQSLIFDQYDRVSKEQDEILQSKVQSIKDKVEQSKAATTTTTVSSSSKTPSSPQKR